MRDSGFALNPTFIFESLRHTFLRYDQRSLFYFLLGHQYKFARRGVSPFGSYFEFGTGVGDSLHAFLMALRDFCRTSGYDPADFRVCAFDTFSGLPPVASWKDNSREWHQGMFAASQDQIRARLRRASLEKLAGSLRFVQGRFEDTLSPQLRSDLAPSDSAAPAIVTIDVDYYSSTRTVLEWLRPVLPSGAFVYFDDLWSFHGNPRYGQWAAIDEFNSAKEGLLRNNPSIPPGGLAANLFVYSRRDFEYKGKPSS